MSYVVAASTNVAFRPYRFDRTVDGKKVVEKGKWPMFPEKVQYATDKRGVVLIPSDDVSCLLPKEYDKDKVGTHYTLNDPKGLVAPMEQGQKVGTVTPS